MVPAGIVSSNIMMLPPVASLRRRIELVRTDSATTCCLSIVRPLSGQVNTLPAPAIASEAKQSHPCGRLLRYARDDRTADGLSRFYSLDHCLCLTRDRPRVINIELDMLARKRRHA